MATRTLTKGNIREHLEFLPIAGFHWMTGYASHIGVFSSERKRRLIVSESCRRSEGLSVVATGTVRSQCVLMVIGMAGDASRLQTEESLLFCAQHRVRDKIRGMTLPAIKCGMCPGQGITGSAMIETFDIKPDHIEAPAMVITVAGKTILSNDLR